MATLRPTAGSISGRSSGHDAGAGTPGAGASPAQRVHPALMRPGIALLDQTASDRILPDVVPFLRVVSRVEDPMVPAARLKPPFRKAVLPAQFPFPVVIHGSISKRRSCGAQKQCR